MANSATRRTVGSSNVNATGLMSGTEESKMDIEHRILVIGKSGNGKSAVCNTLTGGQAFQTGRGLSATTRTLQAVDVNRFGYRIKVIDTPDITNCGMTPEQMEAEVRRWRQLTAPYPTAVLLTVRCDVRYTAEEHAIYRHIQRLWGDNSMAERLVVAFTFADRQDEPIEEELPTACVQLKAILRDASQRYVLFDNKASDPEKDRRVQYLLNMVHTSPGPSQSPRHFSFLSRVLMGASVISGLCFAAFVTADMQTPSIVFGLAFFSCGAGVIGLQIKDKLF